MPNAIGKASVLFKKNDKVRRLVPPAIILIGIVVLAGLALVITQRMNELREAPGDNLTWTLSQVEVDVLVAAVHFWHHNDPASRAKRIPAISRTRG